ncbi:uncharacterized protein LY89DRAFT_671121 [Mollisia scopiformis]|uniref:Zn(2)-C6 fungal-type domain-containing protein n=1 Tax=Mollisia scopiformis TaxID=149040 RepID=A0A194X4E4_MOLSC|nr:uncharacterized protein LY89DRAFT_671121 [Mollisia scopiformis]KUJ14697.1 hypothetical protein LY89DRAFT_671121 [Mollisia scopiformis]
MAFPNNDIPASRQKSCNSCVQSKRRCDRQTPVCNRCVEKKRLCVYGKEPSLYSRVSGDIDTDANPDTALEMEGLVFASSNSAASPFPADLSLHVDNFSVERSSMDDVSEPIISTMFDTASNFQTDIDRLMELVGGDDAEAGGQWLFQPDQQITIVRPSTPADEEINRSYEQMGGLCERYEPWQLYDPKTPVHYLVNRIKGFTTDIATHNAAPFMHRYLYREHMPPCILSCFSTSVLYANRTPANTATVLRALQQSVRELLAAESQRAMNTPTEKLARTQALFLYQVIRLFDGDIALRVQAEKDIALLESWLGELCKVRENLGYSLDIEGSRREEPPKEWERWIFAESVRRTVIIAYSVITLYGMMKDTYTTDDIGPWTYVHRWTLSRHLWEAESSFTFFRMWQEKPHFVINNYSFENFVKHGRGDDVDEFAEIMLNAQVAWNPFTWALMRRKSFLAANDFKL